MAAARRLLACVLFGLVRAAPTCTKAVEGVCFVKHDENKIFKADNQAACCAACNARSTCKVWTYRPGRTQCHLRTSWTSSQPTSGPCVTGTMPGVPLPPGPPPQPKQHVVINLDNVTHRLDTKPKMLMGCHTDLGYDHQIYGFYSQRIYGESFENYTLPSDLTPQGNQWTPITNGDVKASFPITHVEPLHGDQAQTITLESVNGQNGRAGVTNKGFKQEGLMFESGKNYIGSIFVRSAKPVTITVSLEDSFEEVVLASAPLHFQGGNWTRLTFNLTVPPSSSPSQCRSFPFDTPPLNCKSGRDSPTGTAGHACIQCSGMVVFALHSPGSVDLDYAELHPGAWGRLHGLPVLLSSVQWLRAAGVDSIRTGGTYVEADEDEDRDGDPGYLWKKMRGPRHLRPGPIRSVGGPSKGDLTTRGWGPFESIDMATAMGITPIITLRSSESYEDLGDLVHYLFSEDVISDPMAALRHADGHPDPYNVSWFEIGNEVKTQDFAGRAAAMEVEANRLGKGGELRYACPANCGVDAFATDEARGLGAQLYVDIHDGGSSLEAAKQWTAKLQSINSSARLVVWETNTRKHDFSRVVVEAQDLNDLITNAVYYPLDSRVESFCMEKSGHDDGLWSKQHFLGDQGSIFFAPNSTWAQPPHYVHSMFAQHWFQKVVQVSATPSLSVSGVLSEDGLQVAVRVLAKEDVNVTFGLKSGGVSPQGVRVTVTQLTAPTLASDNPIWDPERYSPEMVVVGVNHSSQDIHFLHSNSFSVFLFELSS